MPSSDIIGVVTIKVADFLHFFLFLCGPSNLLDSLDNHTVLRYLRSSFAFSDVFFEKKGFLVSSEG